MNKGNLIILGIIVAILSIGIFLMVNIKDEITTNPAVTSAPAARPEEPDLLIIPKLNIEAKVESVGLDKFNAMEVPKGVQNVGWYNLGYRPGDVGNAVMAGHFDDVRGGPAVFFHLKKLKVGDEVISRSIGPDSKARDIRFKVALIETYKYNQVPLQQVFGDFPIARLNLITCGGQWDHNTRNYSERTVVYTRLAE